MNLAELVEATHDATQDDPQLTLEEALALLPDTTPKWAIEDEALRTELEELVILTAASKFYEQ
jgi:hypothetical protein